MEIVIDTSALIAVIVAEPERDRIVEATMGHTLIGPGSIPWEVGNAFSAMLKQHRMRLQDAHRGLAILDGIPLRFVNVDLANALSLANRTNMYAHDAYFLDCASRHSAPLLTLDVSLRRAATRIGVNLIEV
ncbi:MAG: type II toxin-antitoxin system VapC family toxin [Planctomycetota bacterium]